ncbi:hypothetical protein PCANC_01747 [Puccinia coronata f. sp. avenae]|uniref:Uncharacterized protein n=1 Tax=Puccinia coronata f. sp. avenae TaxID=200324 RepID=A0A2N5W3J9_9BASI|nr:hypothetical protein PCANC_01747 [Puccinia coronata f. sp. avenae]
MAPKAPKEPKVPDNLDSITEVAEAHVTALHGRTRKANKHRKFVDTKDYIHLANAFIDAYGCIQGQYPCLSLVCLDAMLTKYCQLIKIWLKIQKDVNTSVKDIDLNVSTHLESRGMDPTDAVDKSWEVKMTEFWKSFKLSPPVPSLSRALFFLLEANWAKFEARKELATIDRLHQRQKLLS